jgi:hypothetical protein
VPFDPHATAADLRALADQLAAEAEHRDKQLGSADIAAMAPHDVEAARQRGQFRDLLTGTDPNPRKDA